MSLTTATITAGSFSVWKILKKTRRLLFVSVTLWIRTLRSETSQIYHPDGTLGVEARANRGSVNRTQMTKNKPMGPKHTIETDRLRGSFCALAKRPCGVNVRRQRDEPN